VNSQLFKHPESLMADRQHKQATIVDAALRLAATRAWTDVRINDIAAEAGIGLADLAETIDGKADILRLYGRQLDARMLRSLETDPVSGTPHDRLFDIIMRRLELMDADKAAVRSIVKAPVSSAAGFVTLAGSLLQSQDWILSAAGIEDSGLRAAIRTSGLAMIYVRTLRTWAEDDDPGLARTMAQLDRALRDGSDWVKRLDAPAALATTLASLARGFMKARGGPPPASNDTGSTATASAPEDPGKAPPADTSTPKSAPESP
jgi:AcrR family transcriptional regulator